MYEENLEPLPAGDATVVFADILDNIRRRDPATAADTVSPDNVVQWACHDLQRTVAAMARRLLLPGSQLVGLERLDELTRLARAGHSCVICLNHRCNLDVPTLLVLLEDFGRPDLFERIVWIAGRKLNEDPGLTPILIRGFNRVVITPRSWMTDERSPEEQSLAHQINIAALRAIHELRHQGWVFGLFPSGTRIRPDDEATKRAIDETDSYLKNFEFMQLGRIDGCTLPVSRDRDLTHEVPRRDRMCYTFGPVRRTAGWRTEAKQRFPRLDQRAASAKAIMQDIEANP